jgi:hypothetical protein
LSLSGWLSCAIAAFQQKNRKNWGCIVDAALIFFTPRWRPVGVHCGENRRHDVAIWQPVRASQPKGSGHIFERSFG